MYLDKPLKDHTLLQAIARVNRPLSDEEGEKKTAGLIVDYIGILDNLKRALTFDSATIEGALTDLTVLKEKFVELMNQSKEYLAIMEGGINDKTLGAISERFLTLEEREKFFKLFRQIEEVYEILSPDIFLRDYLEAYKSLTQLYKIIQNIFRPPEADILRDLKNKTKNLIRKHVDLSAIIHSLPSYEIDDKIIAKVESERAPVKRKAINLYRSIVLHVQTNVKQEPYLYSIGERAEEIIKKFQANQIESQKALDEMMKVAEEIASAEAERNQYKLSRDEFNVYFVLRANKISNDIVALTKELVQILDSRKSWPMSKKKEMEVRRDIYKLLLTKVERDRLPDVVNSVLEIHRRMVGR